MQDIKALSKKPKGLLEKKVWFPGIDKAVEETVKNCIYSQASTVSNSVEPLTMSPLPSAPWSELSIDFSGPYPNGEYFLVLIDEYSRFPFVEIVKSTSAFSVIPVLEHLFCTFEIPGVLKSDNGPPFNSHEFKLFAKRLGFRHRKITPLWPKPNAECERFMKTLIKNTRISHAQKSSWKSDLHTFLLNYRATPHSITNKSPGDIFFGRQIHTTLPQFQTQLSNSQHQALRNADASAKSKIKSCADKKLNAKQRSFQVGDTVLLKVKRERKLMLPYKPTPYTVTQVKESLITAQQKHGTHKVTRNISFFKLVNDTNSDVYNDVSDDDCYFPFDDTDSFSCDNNDITRTDNLPLRRYPERSRNRPRYLENYV